MTAEEIEAARTPNGGWTRETLAQWGVPWPPPKGWKSELLSPRLKPLVETTKMGSMRSTKAGIAPKTNGMTGGKQWRVR